MADYYPLLARALDALPDRSPALRKAVYDRARSALLGQLRTMDPPLPEIDIEAERQALDGAIARLEADYGALAPAEPKPAVPSAPPGAPSLQPSTSAPTPPATVMPRAIPVETVRPPPVPPAVLTPEPEAPTSLPEPGPPPTFVPFVAPARRSRSDETVPDPATASQAADASGHAEPVPLPSEAAGGRRPRLDVKPPRADRSRRLRNLFLGSVLALVIGLIAVAAMLLADKRVDLAQNAGDGSNAARTAPDAKLSDRIGSDRSDADARVGAGAETGRVDLTVAQRAVLYEESGGDAKAPPVATQGRAIWRLDSVSGEQSQPLQSAVRATIDFADAGLSLTMTIRKNLDASLPASHTIELAFTNTGTAGEKRAVQEIGLLQLKDEESGRGSPVSGLPVRVRDNLFLIGLSNLPSDIERNTELLTHRNWWDLAVKYKNGQRAILSFEKGANGARVVQGAFDQWRG